MFDLSIPWWEMVIRAIIVYAALILLIRLTGKRQIGQLSPFDLILLLILSDAVQNSMNGGDESLIGGLITAITLITLNYLMGLAALKNPRLEHMIEGRPQVLVREGKLFKEVMAEARLSDLELETALRQHECASIEEVQWAILENNGTISVLKRDKKA